MSADWLQALTGWLADNPEWLALALFVTAFFESLALAGIVIPGVAILFGIAVLAGQTAMPIVEALAWAGLGAIAGDGISFALGRLFQGRLDALWPLSRYPQFIDKGERFFRRHGGKSVIIGRFVGPIRPIIPLIAGALLMPWRRFLTFNVFSALGWAPVYILPGYLVGSAMASDLKPPPHFYLVVGISSLILLAIYLMLFRFQLGLGKGSRPYEWLAAKMADYNSTHWFWRQYSSQRPDQTGEFPLPSLMLGLGALALFMIGTQMVLATDVLLPFDQEAANWLALLRHPLLDTAFVAITMLGDPQVLTLGAALFASALAIRGHYAAGIHVVAAAAVTALAVWSLKDATAIARPELAVQPPSSGAYPSGHATGITVMFSLLAAFVARENRIGARWQIYAMFSLPIVLVAISRVYLGVHWFTDIIAGVFLGMAVTGFVRASFSRFDNTPISMDPLMVGAVTTWVGLSLWYMAHNWAHAIAIYAPSTT